MPQVYSTGPSVATYISIRLERAKGGGILVNTGGLEGHASFRAPLPHPPFLVPLPSSPATPSQTGPLFHLVESLISFWEDCLCV